MAVLQQLIANLNLVPKPKSASATAATPTETSAKTKAKSSAEPWIAPAGIRGSIGSAVSVQTCIIRPECRYAGSRGKPPCSNGVHIAGYGIARAKTGSSSCHWSHTGRTSSVSTWHINHLLFRIVSNFTCCANRSSIYSRKTLNVFRVFLRSFQDTEPATKPGHRAFAQRPRSVKSRHLVVVLLQISNSVKCFGFAQNHCTNPTVEMFCDDGAFGSEDEEYIFVDVT